MPLFTIGFVIFPDLTLLDFTGPLQVLSRLPKSATHIVAKSAAPVPSDCRFGLVPTHTFDSGNPDRASPAIKSAVIAEGYNDSLSAYRAVIAKAAQL